MIPGMNPRQMRQAMKKMGMQQQEIPASLVVIYGPDKEIHINEPNVTKVVMMGDESFQISGSVVEKAKELEISEEDIQTVMSQTNKSKEEAYEAIKKHEGDLASAIMELNG